MYLLCHHILSELTLIQEVHLAVLDFYLIPENNESSNILKQGLRRLFYWMVVLLIIGILTTTVRGAAAIIMQFSKGPSLLPILTVLQHFIWWIQTTTRWQLNDDWPSL